MASIKYKYGQGNSIEQHLYKINFDKLLVTETFQFSENLDTLWLVIAPISIKIDNFLEEKASDLSELRKDDLIHLKIPVNSKRENGKFDLSSFEAYVKDLYKSNNLEKLKLVGQKDMILLIDNYMSFSEKNQLNSLNNVGYYLEQGKAYKEAIFLLEKIVKEAPNRTVAYINLGDAYWGMGEKEEAKKAYQTYVDQMKANGKESKIPKTVLERI